MVEVRWLPCQPLKAAITRLSNDAYPNEPCSLTSIAHHFWHQLCTVFDWLKELLNVGNYLGYYLAQY